MRSKIADKIIKKSNPDEVKKLRDEVTEFVKETPCDPLPEFDSAKNWVQDRQLENGNYANICIRCKSAFIGHKRRVLCFECANKLD